MGIVDWFKNDLNTEERTLTRDLLSVAVVDKKYYSLELHVIEVIAKNIGVSPMQLLSFILDEVNSGHITKEDGLTVIDHFVRRFLA